MTWREATTERLATANAPAIVSLADMPVYSYFLPSEVLGEATNTVTLIWSGFGSQFTLHLFADLSVPTLISVGSILETQWGVILIQMEL